MRCRPENQGAFEALMEKQLDQGSRGCVHTIFLMFKVAPSSTVSHSTLSASGLIMQQATCWFNIAKWEEEKREKAAKASQIETEVQELRNQVGDLTDKLDTTERAHSKLVREVTTLQRAVPGLLPDPHFHRLRPP
jgi:peptidoglycan hydrolase CwlO-like protein